MKIKNILSVNNAYYLLVFLMLLPMMIWRDFTPANELRYLSIADEALQNGILFSFYNHGIMYADKPPLYLWIVMLGKLIFGSHQMWFLSLFSLLPAFVIQVIMDKWTSIELSPGHRFSAKLMLITTGFFLGASIVLRMDMLMCMFITLSLYTFYKMFTGRESKFDKYLFPLYIFLAVFTKGPVGIFIPVLSILAFLTIKGKIKQAPKFLGFRTWIIILLLCLVMVYPYMDRSWYRLFKRFTV
ncbi:glycosyltransferase family 39 protein [Bacteroides salyersiae]|nr:glycosyltransferase family 39 protein [Bacteroides salyersiae]